MEMQCSGSSQMGAGACFSKDFNSELEMELNYETSKSIDDTNHSQVIKCHAGDGGWRDLIISHAGRSRRILPSWVGR